MSSREQRAQALVDQVDDATGRLLANQLKLVQLASNKDKSVATVASETTSIEAYTSGLIRAVEDMLVISRQLKESWILGQSPKSDKHIAKPQDVERELTQTLGSLHEQLK